MVRKLISGRFGNVLAIVGATQGDAGSIMFLGCWKFVEHGKQVLRQRKVAVPRCPCRRLRTNVSDLFDSIASQIQGQARACWIQKWRNTTFNHRLIHSCHSFIFGKRLMTSCSELARPVRGGYPIFFIVFLIFN